MDPISSTKNPTQAPNTRNTERASYIPPQQEEQARRIQTITQQLHLFAIPEGPTTLATLPFELLSLITDNLPNEILLRLAPTSKEFLTATLLSYRNRENALFRSYMEALINAIQQDKILLPQTIQELRDGLSLWAQSIESEIAKAPHITTIQKTIATGRTYLANILSHGLVRLSKKLYLAPKPTLFSHMERLSDAYQKLHELQQFTPEEPLHDIVLAAEIFKMFFETEETDEALKLINLLISHSAEFDLNILPLLLRQCFRKGMLYQALYCANTIENPFLQENLLKFVAETIREKPFIYKQLVKILQSKISQETNKETQIRDTLLLSQVHFITHQLQLAHSTLSHLQKEDQESKQVQEFFGRHPHTNDQKNFLLFELSYQYISTLNFSQAIDCALMADGEIKIKIYDRIFRRLVQHDRVDLALPLIDQFPEGLKEQQLALLVDHQLSFSRIDQVMAILTPHIEKTWAEARCRELIERLIDTENWQEVMRIIEMIPFLPLQFLCLQPLAKKLLSEKNLPCFHVLIHAAARPETRDLLLQHALILATQETNFDLFKQLHGAITNPMIKEASQSNFAIQLARQGEIERALEEAEKLTLPIYQMPIFFSLIQIILSLDYLHIDYSLKTVLKLASRATFDNMLKALHERERTTGHPIDIFKGDIKIFIEKFEAILTYIQKAQGITQAVQEGMLLLEQAKEIQDQFPEPPRE